MRAAVLLILAIVLPAFARAADPPVLTAYTLSQNTIYPAATAGSGLATTTAIDVAFSEPVRASIKILSANGTAVKSLYSSSSVTNPTPKIWDGTNTAGAFVDDGIYTILIAATSTATSLQMSDSSKTVTILSPDSTPPDASSGAGDTMATAASNNAPPEYIPIPTLRIITDGNRTVSSGADVAFTAVVYDGKGNKRDDAVVTYAFGDGMRSTGASVYHKYYDPGEYLAVVHAVTSDGGSLFSEMIVTVKDARITIASLSSRGITLANNDSRTLDLSLWRLTEGGQEFRIPEDTQILAGRTILFPSQVTKLPLADSAFLLYPSGEVAAAYPPLPAVAPADRQPSVVATSYEQVQKVDPIISPKKNSQAHEEAVIAPAAANELAAAGAALALGGEGAAAGILSSPWTLGFLGVLLLAGGAFIFL